MLTWLFGENLVCGLLSASGLPESPSLQEMLSLTVAMPLIGQWRASLEGTFWDGRDCLWVMVRRPSAACYFGKSLVWHETKPAAVTQFATPRSPASPARVSSGRGPAGQVLGSPWSLVKPAWS